MRHETQHDDTHHNNIERTEPSSIMHILLMKSIMTQRIINLSRMPLTTTKLSITNTAHICGEQYNDAQ